MKLEGITVADDRGFFTKLARAGNLPQYVKRACRRSTANACRQFPRSMQSVQIRCLTQSQSGTAGHDPRYPPAEGKGQIAHHR